MNPQSRRRFLQTVGVAAGSALLSRSARSLGALSGRRKPNIILFVADDLGYRELGCYGQTRIRTPHIDKLAGGGVRFTQHYSGSPVCAPSRCVLLTGKHTGHAFIRDNREVQPEGQFPIPAETVTLPRLLRSAGYETAAIGKWGLGPFGSTGDPLNHGIDLFFGYNCQRHAHNYYPEFIHRNAERIPLEGNTRGLTGRHYTPDLMETEALQFIRKNKDVPFFLYYPNPIPHLALQAPEALIDEYKGLWDDPPYDGKKHYLPHEHPRATYAAMVTHMDRTVGRLMAELAKHGLEEETLVLFTSDNGSTFDLGGYDPPFFNGTGELRGTKGSVYEGGIRVPLIAHWPGTIDAGETNDHICAFQDIMPTLLETAGISEKTEIDGLSFAPLLLGKGGQQQHKHLYMEFPSYGGQQMVRMGKWKGVRQNLFKDLQAPIELYDLESDVSEKHDVAAAHPEVVEAIRTIMRTERVPSSEFPFPALDG